MITERFDNAFHLHRKAPPGSVNAVVQNGLSAHMHGLPLPVGRGKTFPREEDKKFPGCFANPNTVCKLIDDATVEYAEKEFGIETRTRDETALLKNTEKSALNPFHL